MKIRMMMIYLVDLSMSGCSQDVDSSEEDASEVEGSTGHATLLVLQA
jgi:hypothetical protein